MSYILDALKKSESERKQANTPPTIYSPAPAPPPKPEGGEQKTRPLFWVALAVVLILAVIAVGYTFWGHKNISITISVPEETTPVNKPETPADINSENDSATPGTQKLEVAKTPASANEPLLDTITDNRQNDATTQLQPEVPRPYIPALEEMETAFQNSIPELKLAGHVYSEDSALRMILINSNVVREKGTVVKNLILDEITPDGIILRKQGIRFRIDIP